VEKDRSIPPGTRSSLVDPAFAKTINYYSRLRKIILYMCERDSAPLSLGQAAQIACMEKTGFSRFFKRVTGIGFRAFVQQWRIGLAVDFLRTGDNTITDVATMLDFTLATFERTFKRIMGQTPSDYRRLCRQAESGLNRTAENRNDTVERLQREFQHDGRVDSDIWLDSTDHES